MTENWTGEGIESDLIFYLISNFLIYRIYCSEKYKVKMQHFSQRLDQLSSYDLLNYLEVSPLLSMLPFKNTWNHVHKDASLVLLFTFTASTTLFW